MGWKNWPYWIRGGLLGAIITIIGYIFIIMVGIGFPILFYIPDIIIALPYRFIAKSFVYNILGSNLGSYVLLFSYIIAIFPNFIIGAIIGLIIGKIKSKKQKEASV